MAYDFNSLTKQAAEASNRDKFYTDFEDVDPSKLHQITELTEWMRTKAKGSDVREVIAQLFERTWVEGIKEGNANLEVAQARGTYPNLKSRLDNVDNKQKQTTAQLQQTAARVDTFTALESGSTTGDAELIDGRVGADGVVYSNIGGAIRSQITDITQGNAVLKSEWISGFVDKNGGIEANANVITQTELQPILDGEKIRITIAQGYSFAISWYNSRGTLARRASSWITETTEITKKYNFYRLSILKTGIALSDSNKIGVKKINYYFSADEIKNKIENLGKIENTFSPIGETYKYLFSKAICIGDSLTRGYYTSDLNNDDGLLPNYPKTLAKITGWTVTQAGKSGATAKSWHDKRLNLFDYSAHDVAIIYLGTNAGLEEYSTTQTDTTNLGCYRKIIQRILSDNPNCKILMCTVSNVSGSTVKTTNDSIRSLANEFANCFVMDLKDNGIVDLSDEALHPNDPVHFTGIGYMTQAYVISCLIKKTIADNVASFDITS